MNIKILCLALSICFCGNMFAQVSTDVSKDKLKGTVRSVQTESYEAKRNNPTPVKAIHLETYLTKYTREGLKERTEYLSGTGSLTYYAAYKRDAYGNIILETIRDPKELALGKTLFSYTDKNQVREEYIFSGYNELENAISYHYDAKGNCIRKIYMVEGQNITETHEQSYDTSNQLATVSISNAKGKKKMEILYEYDTYQNPITTNTFDYTLAEVKLRAETFEYEYDAYGNWIRKIQYRLEKEKLVPYYIYERKIEYYE